MLLVGVSAIPVSRCLKKEQIRTHAGYHKRSSDVPNRLTNIGTHRRAILVLERAKLRMVVLHRQATRPPEDDNDRGVLLLLLPVQAYALQRSVQRCGARELLERRS